MKTMPKTWVIMGVAGCGKSLIGAKLAQALNGNFEDADVYHSLANKIKMEKNIPLTDEDRWPWLQELHSLIALHQTLTPCYVLACSALKQSYRDMLRVEGLANVPQFVFLKGTKELFAQRIAERATNPVDVKPEFLDSQFATLEEPQDAIIVDANLTPDEIVAFILDQFS
ncbi:gluconokinase [Crenothrix polyspora]|uniref:Gluconokinase n=1 Tax=Crenothrix polyspora TaxID=360316 RepID=A0A1R4HE35_9GAMM|nr:gluconokinase, GntK/IdnK-type [Crenothrix polyspora]SJM94483.1 Carbohydrate kinase [Crenothrix polyspora]